MGFADNIGDGNVSDRLVPTRVNLPRGVTQLTAGSSLACALDAKGQAYCWGYDELGALGDWHRLQLRSPIQVAAGFRWQRVSVSDASFCGIGAGASDVGQVYCQGRNDFGQLGIGTRVQSYPPLGVLP